MSDDTWAALADQFADGAYASVKGRVRTYVLHQQLLEHLPAPPAPVLDVGGGAGHQSFPLAQAGYDVTLLDPSPAMLVKAGQRFAAVLCHGVLGYLEDPDALVSELCRSAAPGGLVSIMAGNANAMAVRPALERRWDEALASFDARDEIGVLGVPTRSHTVEELSGLLQGHGTKRPASRSSRCVSGRRDSRPWRRSPPSGRWGRRCWRRSGRRPR
jgi:SAM-dependent methyltransferase